LFNVTFYVVDLRVGTGAGASSDIVPVTINCCCSPVPAGSGIRDITIIEIANKYSSIRIQNVKKLVAHVAFFSKGIH
jgi:hypothetical protein